MTPAEERVVQEMTRAWKDRALGAEARVKELERHVSELTTRVQELEAGILRCAGMEVNR